MVDSIENENQDSESSSILEHALLESLFYNEMLMMDGISSSTSPDVVSGLFTNPENASFPQDFGTLGDKDLLQNFGFSDVVESHDFSMPSNATAVQDPLSFENYNQSSLQNLGEFTVKPSEETSQTNLLISQFAVLASRLGIELPSDVLSSLSHQANSRGAIDGWQSSYEESLTALSTLIESQAQRGTATQKTNMVNCTTETTESPVKLVELNTVAEVAIANVTETRKRSVTDLTKDSKSQQYNKRRKKPRLAECESKFEALKAENVTLKRHLDNITNRSKRFDAERKAKECEMKRLIEVGAGSEELNMLLKQFSEVYSDYGENRHQELSFHLQQLQRLVAPTNFTKMGLWTLGQNEKFYTDLKRYPIAGILREELRITPQQGRKIVEQSQKIRELSENLKECLKLLGKLKSICEYKQKVFSDRMSKCQEILTPLQVAKLLLWVDDNSNILESTCPGWGSERITSRGKKESSK